MKNHKALTVLNQVIFFLFLACCSFLSQAQEVVDRKSELGFIILGDWGMRGSEGQRMVAAQMNNLAKGKKIDFIITTGDNFYPSGVESADDPAWFINYESVYSLPYLKDIPWYVSLGNHDHMGEIQAQIDYGKNNPNWILKNNYYSETLVSRPGILVDLFILDTSIFVDKYRLEPELYKTVKYDPADQIKWLRDKLSNSKSKWKIVAGHHPVYASGMHGDTVELANQLPEIFQEYNVQLYFAGHDHHLEHIYPGQSTHYIISGGGSKTRPVTNGLNTKFIRESLGFVYAAINKSHAEISFIDHTGEILYRSLIQ